MDKWNSICILEKNHAVPRLVKIGNRDDIMVMERKEVGDNRMEVYIKID